MWEFVFVCLIGFTAASIQSSTGFGFGILAMGLWPLILSYTDASLMVIICTTCLTGFIAIRNIRHVKAKIIIVPAILALVGNYLGLTCMMRSDNSFMLKLLGVFLLVLSAYFFLFAHRIQIKSNVFSAIVAGFATVGLSGLFNIGGPPMVLYYSVVIKEKNAYRATLQMFFLINLLFKICYFLIIGRTIENLFALPFALGGSVAGIAAGSYIFNRLPVEKVKRAVYGLMALMGLWYIIQ